MEKRPHRIRDLTENLISVIERYKSYIVLAVLGLFFIIVGYEYYSRYFYVFRNPESIKSFVMAYEGYALIVFTLLQVLQVVAFFIPGELVQIAGGYIYGTFFGGLISIVGITIGSAIAYGIANVYGKPFVKKIISEKNIKAVEKTLNLGSKKMVVFLIYVIPGIPKDVVAYICGVSTISFKEFIIYSTLGRIPCIFLSAYFGSKLISGNKLLLIFLAIVASALFVFGVYKGERIIKGIVKK